MSALTRWTAFALGATVLFAASAQAQTRTIAIVGGEIHTLNGPPIANGTVVIENGRITAVGAAVSAPEGADIIDARDLRVYPGMFDSFSQIGLREINAVDVTNDVQEGGDFNPHLAAATAVHPASEHIPVTRANGITHALTAPSASRGGIGGQASAIHLDGWTIEEMLIERTVGLVMSFPSIQTRRCSTFGCFGPAGPYSEAEESYEEAMDQVRGWFDDARRFRQAADAGSTRRDLKMEAMGRVLDGEVPLLVLADRARDIRNAVGFAEEQDVRIVIVSGRDAWKEADFLAEHDVPVLLRATQNVPPNRDDPYYTTFSGPAKLYEAGVRFAMTSWASAGPNPPSRTLPYEAANSVSFGLSEEEALKAITRYPAEILGLGDDLGTIETGKIANLIVTDGSPLQIRTQMVHVIINGNEVSLDNKQKALWEKYRARR
ncbi:MAG: amidohydrolase [Gemmatimonadota bacterium]|nr:MAG: amidohydrolase [Gemmatimonadota bacterium]